MLRCTRLMSATTIGRLVALAPPAIGFVLALTVTSSTRHGVEIIAGSAVVGLILFAASVPLLAAPRLPWRISGRLLRGVPVVRLTTTHFLSAWDPSGATLPFKPGVVEYRLDGDRQVVARFAFDDGTSLTRLGPPVTRPSGRVERSD